MATAATAAKLLASLDLDTKPFERGAARTNQTLGRMESRFSKIGGIAQKGLGNAANNLKKIGAVVGGFIAANIAVGIQSLADLETAVNQTNAVIASTGGKAKVSATQVRSLAESFETLTTVDDKVIQGGENMLLTFTNIGADVFPAATKAAIDMAIAMNGGNAEGIDLKATAIQLGKALNDPVRGMGALRKVGVTFTKEQEKQIKGFVKSGQLAKAQGVILKELGVEFGKAGEAAGKGFGADMRRFKDAVEGAQQALAVGFLPLIRKVSGFLTEKLADPAVLSKITAFGDSLAGAFDQLLGAAEKIPWGTIGNSLTIAGSGAKALFDAFTQMPAWVQTAVLTGWGLNKLTGGMVTGIVSELGKGLIKGVLSMNAGVVNVNAAKVAGPGSGPGAPVAAGGIGLLAGALGLISIGALEIAIADAIGPDFRKFFTGSDAPITTDTKVADLGPLEIKIGPQVYQQVRQGVTDAMRENQHNPGVPFTDKGDAGSRKVVTVTREESQRREREAAAQKRAIEQARDRIETARIATVSKIDTTNQNLTAIGSKLDRLGTMPFVLNLNVNGQTSQTTTWVNRSNGASGVVGPGHGL